MLDADIDLDAIFVPRKQQEQDFRAFLLRWEETRQTSGTSPVQSHPSSSSITKIPGAVGLLYGESGIGKSTMLQRFCNIALEAQYGIRTCYIDWSSSSLFDSTLFSAIPQQEIDTLRYFNNLHKKLANALSEPREDLQEQQDEIKKHLEQDFSVYNNAVASMIKLKERAEEVIGRLNTSDINQKYKGIDILTKAALLKLVRKFFAEKWMELDDKEVENRIKRCIGEESYLRKMHIIEIIEELDKALPDGQLENYLYPENLLARALASDLSSLARQNPLLIFFDTYERIASAHHCVQHVMSATGRRVGWVIAGQPGPWSDKEQTEYNMLRQHRPSKIVLTGPQLTIDLSTHNVGRFSNQEIIFYFENVYPKDPSLQKISPSEIKRISELTRGVPLVVKEVVNIYVSGLELDSALKNATDSMVTLYLASTQNNERERAKIYGLALLSLTDNQEVIADVLDIESHTDYSYEHVIQQMRRSHSFITIEQNQPRLYENVYNILRHWLLEVGRTLSSCILVIERLIEARKVQLQNLGWYRTRQTLQAYMQDDVWVNAYLDFIEAKFWRKPDEGVSLMLAFMLAVTLYQPAALYKAQAIGNFFAEGGILPTEPLKLWQVASKSLMPPFTTAYLPDLTQELDALNKLSANLQRLPHVSEYNYKNSNKPINYHWGLKQLKQYVKGTEDEQDLFTYEYRLLENIDRESKNGTNEQVRSERVPIMDKLNSLTKKVADISFNELCSQESFLIERKHFSELEGAICWIKGQVISRSNLKEALTYYRQALNYLGEHENLREDYAYTCWKAAAECFERKDYVECIDYLYKALEIKNNYTHAYFSLGNVLYAQEQYQQAIIPYTQVLIIDKLYTPAHVNLGNTYSELKKYEEALKEYEAARALDEKNHICYYNIGNAHVELKEYEKAINDFSHSILLAKDIQAKSAKASDINVDLADAHVNRGNAYGLSGNYAKARQDYTTAAELDQSDIHNAWLALWSQLGKTVVESELVKQLQRLIQLDNQHYIASICQAIILVFQAKDQPPELDTVNTVLRQAFFLEGKEQCDPYFWQGFIFAYYGLVEEANASIKASLAHDLPPLLLMPLYWLKATQSIFFNTYAKSLLENYEL